MIREVKDLPAPGLWSPRICCSDRLMSPKLTNSFSANADVALFHAGACFFHQPQPSDAIHRTNSVRPASISSATLDSKLLVVSIVDLVQWSSG